MRLGPIILCGCIAASGCVRFGFEPNVAPADAGPGNDATIDLPISTGDTSALDTTPPDGSLADRSSNPDLTASDWSGATSMTWVSGSSATQAAGSYGTKGVPASTNVPSARYGSAIGCDPQGKIWAFGGNASDASAAALNNDLWRFDGKQWAWIAGASTQFQAGLYGQQGIPAAGNVPGARQYPAIWVDGKGLVWIFGGWGRDEAGTQTRWLNDLWRFDGKLWTWIAGGKVNDQVATYGTRGVGAPGNTPGGRDGAGTSVEPSTDHLWLFGGKGYASSSSFGYLNDVWRFDGKAWAWIAGSQDRNSPPTYGTQGIPDPQNLPGGRAWSCTWRQGGQLWVFGGLGLDSQSATTGKIYLLNDLWRFDGKQWAWIDGATTGNSSGVYGTKGVGAPGNRPGARYKLGCWSDQNGLWIFGGYGFAATATAGGLNDLWRFDGKVWTWIAGNDTIDAQGSYGTRGVPDASSYPGARVATAACRCSSEAWIFAGTGVDGSGQVGVLNDLWRLSFH
jgi:N-acetylneuraminic acid mutarotase